MNLLITPHRFSTGDYHRMVESGVLREDARVELLNGVITDMMPIGPFHGGCVKWLSKCFQSLSGDRWITSTQDPITLSEYDEPQPDLALLRPAEDFYVHAHPQAEDVFVVVEVSDSSLRGDRQEKLPLYAKAGVPEVWIVNLQESTVEVYQKPDGDGYGEKQIFDSDDSVAPVTFPDAMIDLGKLFGLGRH